MPRLQALLLAAAMSAVPTLAYAHAHLRASDPPAGGTLRTAPTEVAITFSEAVEPRFSSISVKDAAGKEVDRKDVHTAGSDAHVLAVGVEALAPGAYTVEWHATAVDTHKTEGTFGFTVAP